MRTRDRSATLALLAAATAAGAGSAGAAPPTVTPGTVVRWPGTRIDSCAVADRSWAPTSGACFFPVDLLARGSLRLERRRAGRGESLTVRIGSYPYPEQRLEVEDRMVDLSQEDLARVERENREIAALWQRESLPRFTLPLAAPLSSLPAGGRFGARRIFNDQPRSPHGGADYSAPAGTPVLAADEGVAVLVADHFFGGNSVYLDHGGGLITMYFHLGRVDVAAGQRVARGAVLGAVGATGRATGPHLHFGVRWHGARVDPALLLGPVAAITTVGAAEQTPVE
jgi:murein DD-endopeptidase MepM/ murein hydrolase activator NlpD